MQRYAILACATLILLLTLCGRDTYAQSNELPKFEVDAHFSSLSLDRGFQTQTEPGLGGRFGFNLTRNLAIEAEGNFFPRDTGFGSRNGGRAVQGLFGVKFGKRYEKFGIFAKARPGFISFSQGRFDLVPNTSNPDSFSPVVVRTERLTHFAADIGGVIEFYPTRRIFTRIDAGDTIIRYGQTTFNYLSVGPGNQLIPTTVTLTEETKHNFQFSAGVGFRF